MTSTSRNIVLGIGVLLLVGAAFMAGRHMAAHPEEPVAGQLGDQSLTLDEVDQIWREFDPAQYSATTQGLYEGRRTALDRLVAGMLLEKAVAGTNRDVETYMKDELARRRRPVTDGEIAAFYEANKGQMDGRSLEELRGEIANFLEQQHEAETRQQVVDDLKKTAPQLRVMLDPPRFVIPTASDDASAGPSDARVTIVEFSDYQCPYCAQLAPTLRKLRATYGDRVRFVWKDFPLTQIHPYAFKAAEAAHCAGEQGKYWEYHDRLFSNQQALDVPSLSKSAVEIGLDGRRFTECLGSGKHTQKVQTGMEAGAKLGINSTPTTFINGRMVPGALPYENLAAMIDDELAARR